MLSLCLPDNCSHALESCAPLMEFEADLGTRHPVQALNLPRKPIQSLNIIV